MQGRLLPCEGVFLASEVVLIADGHLELGLEFEGPELLLVLGAFFWGGLEVENLQIVVVDSQFVE
jgi:hypothetical protein